MYKHHVLLSWCAVIIAVLMLFNPVIALAVPADFEDNGEDETVPVDTTTGTENEDVFGILAGKDTMQDVAAYINYKRMYETDIAAIEWSFVLSQLAKPFEEDLTDVLSNELILQMKEQNLTISNTPDIVDSDYVYAPVGSEYATDSVQFGTVWDTISKNIRYNSLISEDLQHYTVRSFLTNGVYDKQGFISDYVFTDKEGKYSEEVAKEELKNNIEALYGLDAEDNSTKLIEYLRNPSLSLTKDPNDGVRGQRRLVPVFVGSELSNLYIQTALMVYCKENAGDSMNFQKLLTDYGSERMYIDSFGNIAFYDSKTSQYKIILPNAYNSVFTSSYSQDYIGLYSNGSTPIVDDAIKKADNRPLELGEYKGGKIRKPIGMINQEMYTRVPGWSEQTFMYNKLLGTVYSTRRRLSDTVIDDTVYQDNENDMAVAQYASFIGPNIANRTDFRNSLVFAKPDLLYLSPNLYGQYKITNSGSTIGKFFTDLFVKDATEKMSYKYIPKYSDFISQAVDTGSKFGNYLRLDTILYNSTVPNGTSYVSGTEDDAGTYISLKHAYAQNTYMAILQTANDTTMVDSRNMTIKDADNTKSNGAIAFPIHETQLKDVEDATLLGDEGGFLEDYKQLFKIEKVKKSISLGEYKKLTEEQRIGYEPQFTVSSPKNPIGYFKMVDTIVESDSATYLLKRDNRISNRYSMFPLDDIMTLSYVWLNDYVPSLSIADFRNGGSYAEDTQRFLSTAAPQGSMESVVMLAFDTGSYPTEKLTWCNYSYADTTKAEAAYKAMKEGESVSGNPFSKTTMVNSRALWVGLYRNTDSVINPDSPIKFTLKEKTVDVDELLKKINFGIDNPLTKISNAISGLSQMLHNAIAVGLNSNILITITETVTFQKLLSAYLIFGAMVLMLFLVWQIIRIAFNRNRLANTLSETAALCVLIAIVPILFNVIIGLNSKGFKTVMQTANDKATLISVQKTIDGFINKDKTAEARYMAYRQQFENITDVYRASDMQLFDSISEGEPTYKSKSIDEMVNHISMKLNQEVVDESGTRVWYTPNEFIEVQKANYSTDFSKYFYDYIMYRYLEYYNKHDLATTSFGSVATQMPTDDKEIAARLDKVLHNLKGGFGRMLEDTVYVESVDLTGITNFMNSYIETDEGSVPYLRVYANVLEYTMRQKYNMTNKLDGDTLILPYGRQALEESDPWRSEYYKDYVAYLKAKEPTAKGNFGKIDNAIEQAYTNTMRRAREMAKYRTGEFYDTALIYTTSIIASQELCKALGNVEYGIKDISDLDKLMRVIYSTNTEDIYNQEAIMYVIQDRIGGGVFLTLLIAIYEICYIVVTFLNIIVCAFAAFVVPFCLWMIWKRKVQDGQIHCFIGMLTQVVGQLLSLYLTLTPLTIMSMMANKPMSTMTYWIATIMLVVVSVVGVIMSLTLFKIFLRDMKTMGGSVIVAAVSSMMQNAQNSNLQSGNTTMDTTNIDIGNAEINAKESDTTIESDSIEVSADNATLDSDNTKSTPVYEYNPEEETDSTSVEEI